MLEDKGTHLHDPETGHNYAKSESRDKPRKKRKMAHYTTGQWDMVLPLYCAYRAGRMTIEELSKATGIKGHTIHSHAHKKGWPKIADQVNEKTLGKKISPVEQAKSLAQTLAEGGESWQEDVHGLLTGARKYFKRMKGSNILKASTQIKALDDVARRNYKLDADEEQKKQGPVFNVAILHQGGAEIRIVR